MQAWYRGVVAASILPLLSCAGPTQYQFDESGSDVFTASVPPEPAHADAQVPATLEALIHSQQFNAAIELLERELRVQDSAETRQQLAHVIELAEAYDKVIGSDIEEAVNKQDWNTAYRLLDQAATRYPQGETSGEWRNALASHQQERAEELKISLLIERAMWLLQSRSVLEELVSLEPRNTTAQAKLDEVRSEAQSLAAQLSQLGIAALAAKHLEQAERSLTMADRLYPIAENILALERLDRAQHELNQEKRKQRLREEQEQARRETEKRKQSLQAVEERQQQQSRRLVEEINTALNKGDLRRVQTLLEQLRSSDKKHPQIPTLGQALAVAIATRVDELLEKGNVLYSNGEIEQAKSVWEEALVLNPGSTRARARVARAQQVLNNLREQQQKKVSN